MNPAIVISTVDYDRLEALADSLPPAQSGAKNALLGELARANVVDEHELPPATVSMNSTVRFRMTSSGEEFTRRLVYPHDVSQGPDRISVLSPVGTALLGLSAGERIEWETPGCGKVEVTILDIGS
jgi:regulator of nucleoside diphosphate kinase